MKLWTAKEIAIFQQELNKQNTWEQKKKNWILISKQVKSKNPRQCYDYYINHYKICEDIPGQNPDPQQQNQKRDYHSWSEEEIKLLYKMKQNKHTWKDILIQFSNLTLNQVKNKFRDVQKEIDNKKVKALKESIENNGANAQQPQQENKIPLNSNEYMQNLHSLLQQTQTYKSNQMIQYDFKKDLQVPQQSKVRVINNKVSISTHSSIMQMDNKSRNIWNLDKLKNNSDQPSKKPQFINIMQYDNDQQPQLVIENNASFLDFW